ncbi:MAG: P-loop NTPase [Armatimonadota bacterium]|nr:P-loop NTPase [bacterium]
MLDQAEALRMLVRDRVMCCGSDIRSPRLYTIAVTSGKGGVGKTSVAVNLALLLARSGRRVRLVDADFGLSNAEVLLGMAPRHTLNDVLRGRVDASDAWANGPEGLKLLSSGSGLEDMANLDGEAGVSLIDFVLRTASDGEVVVIDTSPGIDRSIGSILAFADEVMMVTTPEPTSITDSYAAMKVLLSKIPDAEITLVANCCSSPSQASSVADGLKNICERFLGRSFQRHEYLPSDATVGWAIRTQKPLVLSSPHCAVGPWLKKMAIKLDDRIRRREFVPDSLELAELVEA